MALLPEISPETDSTLWSALILQGYSYTLQEEDQFSMQYFTQVDCSLLFHGYRLQEVFNLYFVYTVQEEDMQYISLRFIVHIILHGYGLAIK